MSPAAPVGDTAGGQHELSAERIAAAAGVNRTTVSGIGPDLIAPSSRLGRWSSFIENGTSVESRRLKLYNLTSRKSIITEEYTGDPKLVQGRFVVFDSHSEKKSRLKPAKKPRSGNVKAEASAGPKGDGWLGKHLRK